MEAVNPRMEELYSTEPMGETAENVAERYGISRADSDAWARSARTRGPSSAGPLRR